MLLRIDVGQVGGVQLHEVERGRCNDPRVILKRSEISDVINVPSDASARGITADMGFFGLCLRPARLASRGPFCPCACTCGDTGQCSCLL